MVLGKELETYHKYLPEWAEEQGRFVLIKGGEVADFFDTFRDAVQDGYRRYGLEPFMVKQVCFFEEPVVVTRFLVPFCAVSQP